MTSLPETGMPGDGNRAFKEEYLRTRMKWFAALFMVLAMFVAACAEEEEPSDTGGGNGAEEDNSDFLESQGPNDFEPNIQSLIQQECDIIITAGFILGDATAAAAEANPDQKFAIVDFDFADPETFEDVTYDNV